ncbi:Alpha/Beta hydrolase protein [Collybia nuda]|uniref:Alpha/Beta hydrolase protein n=1 Tax=Collybia nuda TaxID=64659 RepID=A0A9P6CGM0_9AGAR|nr:Alpha/Beta hydrolase protein [Collybia nuda]
MTDPARRPRRAISLLEIGGIILTALQLPFVLAWKLFILTIILHGQVKSWRRVLGDAAFRFLSSALSVRKLQFVLGTTRQVYETWAKQNGLPALVEEVGEDARLLWVGPKRTDRVIIYFHGGGYVIPLQDFSASFWNHLRVQLNKHEGLNIGLVIFSYSLVPTAVFPTPLRQAALALNHVIASGVTPENIQIVGDSAGANLLLSLLSHILHPLDGIPRVPLRSRIHGIYLMSPWVSLAGGTRSFVENDKSDVVGAMTFAYCARKVFSGVEESCYPYLDPSLTPGAWFQGIDEVVTRVLISAGDVECLRDGIVQLSERIAQYHSGVTLIVQEGGVHNDPYYDFLAREPKLCALTARIQAWIARGFP